MTEGVVSGGSLTSSPTYNVEPITNTSSLSCANNRRRTRRCAPLRLCFSQFATRTVDNTVDLYAAKPDIRAESRFLPTPPAFDAPVRGVPVRILPCRLVWKKTRMVWLPDGEKISLFFLAQFTNVTDGQTDTAWPYRPRLCIALRGKNYTRSFNIEWISVISLTCAVLPERTNSVLISVFQVGHHRCSLCCPVVEFMCNFLCSSRFSWWICLQFLKLGNSVIVVQFPVTIIQCCRIVNF